MLAGHPQQRRHGELPAIQLRQDLALEAPHQRVLAPLRPVHKRKHRRARFPSFAHALERLVVLEFQQRVEGFLRYVVPHFVAEGKSYLTVAIGCTGGKHRSVYLAEWLKKQMSDVKQVTTRVRHRDLARETA